VPVANRFVHGAKGYPVLLFPSKGKYPHGSSQVKEFGKKKEGQAV